MSDTNASQNSRPWWKELNGYHWFVFVVAALGWLFDCFDQQIFVLFRTPALTSLLPEGTNVGEYAGYATAIFLLGWATGGLVFGVLGDQIGRAKTMMLTILLYSLCTGLTATSQGFADFAFYRFVTGLGVGGEFAVGVALVAEVMPDRARPYSLGLLQALSALGNISAALLAVWVGGLQQQGAISATDGWRMVFWIGAVPALLALVVRIKLKEPEKWRQAKEAGELKGRFGSYAELFGNENWRPPIIGAASLIAAIVAVSFWPAQFNKLGVGFLLALGVIGCGAKAAYGGKGSPWRNNALIGLALACSGVIALWGIVFFSFDLVGSVFAKQFAAAGVEAEKIGGMVGKMKGKTGIMLNLGAFFGIYSFGPLSERIGRKNAFSIMFVGAFLATGAVFLFFNAEHQIYWLIPVMGFFMLGIFGGYAIYFPELFPTHLRSTGTSFCYNVGRFIAAAGPALLGVLTGKVFHEADEPMRYAGLTMCSIFLLGLIVIRFAPETKGKPLPEA